MFLDESGDHSLSCIDPQYPVFVLGGIIVDQKYAEGELSQRIREFKRSLFNTDELTLHTADICRNRNGFERLKEADFRQRFYTELNQLMSELQYQVVACVIRKDAHLARHGLAALDPYMLSLQVLVERFCFEIGNLAGGGVIIAEKRDPTLDHQLELAWLDLRIRGTNYLQAAKIQQRIVGLTLRKKADRIAGLELADLVVSPIGRAAIGKQPKQDYQIIESKFRKNHAGRYLGIGLTVLPKST